MPSLRRRLRTRTRLSLSDLNVCGLMSLQNGWHSQEGSEYKFGYDKHLKTLDDCRAYYESNQSQIDAPYQAGERGHLGENEMHPCTRYWCSWVFGLLVDDPRRRVSTDRSLPTTTTDWPGSMAFGATDGFESSFRYLRRRELLTDDELAAVRKPDYVQGVWNRLEYSRAGVQKLHQHPPEEFDPWDFADFRLACDPDGSLGLLTPEETQAAGPWLEN